MYYVSPFDIIPTHFLKDVMATIWLFINSTLIKGTVSSYPNLDSPELDNYCSISKLPFLSKVPLSNSLCTTPVHGKQFSLFKQ